MMTYNPNMFGGKKKKKKPHWAKHFQLMTYTLKFRKINIQEFGQENSVNPKV